MKKKIGAFCLTIILCLTLLPLQELSTAYADAAVFSPVMGKYYFNNDHFLYSMMETSTDKEKRISGNGEGKLRYNSHDEENSDVDFIINGGYGGAVKNNFGGPDFDTTDITMDKIKSTEKSKKKLTILGGFNTKITFDNSDFESAVISLQSYRERNITPVTLNLKDSQINNVETYGDYYRKPTEYDLKDSYIGNLHINRLGYATIRLDNSQIGHLEADDKTVIDLYMNKSQFVGLENNNCITLNDSAVLNIYLTNENDMYSCARTDNNEAPVVSIGHDAKMNVYSDPENEDEGSLYINDSKHFYNAEWNYDGGNYYCAGIGGLPDNKTHGEFCLNSGMVTCYAMNGGAAIGGSWPDDYSKDGGTVTVKGGQLNAYAGIGAAAIGGAMPSTEFHIPDCLPGDPDNVYTGKTPSIQKDDGSIVDCYVYKNKLTGEETYKELTDEQKNPTVWGNGGNVTLGNCIVNAESQEGAAAIGGGAEGGGGNLTIYRGTVLNAKANVEQFASQQRLSHHNVYDDQAKKDFKDQYECTHGYVLGCGSTFIDPDAKQNYFISDRHSLSAGVVNIIDEAMQGTTNENQSVITCYEEKEDGDYTHSLVNHDFLHKNAQIGKSIEIKKGYDPEKDCVVGNAYFNGENTFNLDGDIDIPVCAKGSYTPAETTVWDLPENVTLNLLDTCVVSCNGEIKGDSKQIILNGAAKIRGNGTWPGKYTGDLTRLPVKPMIPEKLLELKNSYSYLSILEDKDGNNYIYPYDNSGILRMKEVEGKKVCTVFTASEGKFVYDKDKSEWNVTGNSRVSLVSNGGLFACPVKNATDSYFNVSEDKGNVTVKCLGYSLEGTKYTIYAPKKTSESDYFTINFFNDVMDSEKEVAFSAEIDPKNNKSVISIPQMQNCGFKLDTISALRNKNAIRFGGSLSIQTPVSDFAGINLQQLQLSYNGNKTQVDGVEADGHINVPKIAGLIGGGAEVAINTFKGEGYFNMDVSLETPVFEGEFELDFKNVNNMWLPNNLFASISGEPGIPLVPPTVIARLTGGEFGVYGIADTIAGKSKSDYRGDCPLRFHIGCSGKLLEVMEGKIEANVDCNGFDIDMNDAKILGFDFLEHAGWGVRRSYQDKTIRGTKYSGSKVSVYNEMDINVYNAIVVSGKVGVDAFLGINLYSNQNIGIAISAWGNLDGKLQIPKHLIMGLPTSDFKVASLSANFYMELSTTIGNDARTGSKIFMEALKHCSAKGSVSATAQFSLGSWDLCWARACFSFGGNKSVRAMFDGGTGAAKKQNVSMYSRAAYVAPQIQYVPATDNNPEGISILESGLKSVASSDDKVETTQNTLPDMPNKLKAARNYLRMPQEIRINKNDDSNKDISIIIPSSINLNDYLFSFEPMNKEDNFASTDLDGFIATLNDDNYTLTEMKCDNDNHVTQEGNLLCSKAIDTDQTISVFKPATAGVYRFKNDIPFNITAVKKTKFASIDKNVSSLDESNNKVDYTIKDMDEEKQYAVAVTLCKPDANAENAEDGKQYTDGESNKDMKGEYIPLTSNSGTITIADKGQDIPDGDYNVIVKLLEKITIADKDGNKQDQWVCASSECIDNDFHYTHTLPEGTPAKTQNIKAEYSGNEAIKASWDAVDGADGYYVTVLDENKKSTGISFNVNNPKYDITGKVSGYDTPDTSINMSLTNKSQYKNAEGKMVDYPIPETDKNYYISVTAYKDKSTTINGEKLNQTLTGEEALSDLTELKAQHVPEISYSENIYTDDGINSMKVNSSGSTFDIIGKPYDGRTIKSINVTTDNKDIQINTSMDGDKCKVTVPDVDGSLGLKITVTDSCGDYINDYVNVIIDKQPPVLAIDNNGKFEFKDNKASITGFSNNDAKVVLWSEDSDSCKTYVSPDENGLFSIEVDKEGTYQIQAVDMAENASPAYNVEVSADFPDKPSVDPTDKPSDNPTDKPQGDGKADNIHKMIEGANAVWTKGCGLPMIFRSDAPFSEYRSTLMDGKVINPAYLDVSEGSTIVSLKSDYLEKLSVGKHVLTIKSVSGDAVTEFSIKANPQNKTSANTDATNPKTGCMGGETSQSMLTGMWAFTMVYYDTEENKKFYRRLFKKSVENN